MQHDAGRGDRLPGFSPILLANPQFGVDSQTTRARRPPGAAAAQLLNDGLDEQRLPLIVTSQHLAVGSSAADSAALVSSDSIRSRSGWARARSAAITLCPPTSKDILGG